MSETNIDQKDRMILRLLHENGRLSNSDLADKINLSAPACWKRLKHLEKTVISGYQANINYKAMGYRLSAFINIMLDSHSEDSMENFEQLIVEIPNVISCHNITGRYDYLIQMVVIDMDDFHNLTMKRIRKIGNIKEIYSGFSIKEIKSSNCIP